MDPHIVNVRYDSNTTISFKIGSYYTAITSIVVEMKDGQRKLIYAKDNLNISFGKHKISDLKSKKIHITPYQLPNGRNDLKVEFVGGLVKGFMLRSDPIQSDQDNMTDLKQAVMREMEQKYDTKINELQTKNQKLQSKQKKLSKDVTFLSFAWSVIFFAASVYAWDMLNSNQDIRINLLEQKIANIVEWQNTLTPWFLIKTIMQSDACKGIALTLALTLFLIAIANYLDKSKYKKHGSDSLMYQATEVTVDDTII